MTLAARERWWWWSTRRAPNFISRHARPCPLCERRLQLARKRTRGLHANAMHRTPACKHAGAPVILSARSRAGSKLSTQQGAPRSVYIKCKIYSNNVVRTLGRKLAAVSSVINAVGLLPFLLFDRCVGECLVNGACMLAVNLSIPDGYVELARK